MARAGKNKKKCEKYKLSGRREENKRLKQEKDKKRIEKFRKRREEGKCYDYKRHMDHYTEPSDGHKTEFQKWRSIMAKLDNELKAIEKEEKAKSSSKSKTQKTSSTPTDE